MFCLQSVKFVLAKPMAYLVFSVCLSTYHAAVSQQSKKLEPHAWPSHHSLSHDSSVGRSSAIICWSTGLSRANLQLQLLYYCCTTVVRTRTAVGPYRFYVLSLLFRITTYQESLFVCTSMSAAHTVTSIY